MVVVLVVILVVTAAEWVVMAVVVVVVVVGVILVLVAVAVPVVVEVVVVEVAIGDTERWCDFFCLEFILFFCHVLGAAHSAVLFFARVPRGALPLVIESCVLGRF